MKIAVLACCDFSIVGGGERFIIDIATSLDATIIMPSFRDNINKTVLKDFDNFICLNKKLPNEPLKQIIGSHIFKNLKNDFDFVVSVDDMSMYSLNKNIPHLYYVFTPRRAFYDMYYDTMDKKTGIKRLIYYMGISYFRNKDRKHVKNNINNIACISNNVRNRILRTYQKEANVIYPCVHTDKYYNNEPEDFWLSVNRVDKWKRIDLQVESFRRMPDKKLIVVGAIYPEYKSLVDNAPNNVEFKGVVSENELFELYSKCNGLITTATDEDFGLTPLEAMASGKPVVATKEGGYLETVIDGHTGILVIPSTDNIVNAITQIDNTNSLHYKYNCIQQAARFDYDIFKINIENEVNRIYEGHALELL